MDKPEEKQTKPEIIAPTPEETKALAVPCQLHWKDVKYNIAGYIRRVGNALAGERVELDHVFGRCLGERSDGKVFFATTILPWIWDDPAYDWKMVARSRLDSFLFPECKCDARTEESKVCEFHLDAIGQWESDDRRSMGLAEARKMPKANEGGGVFPLSKEMHADYPWVREQEGRYLCTVCGFGKDQRGAVGNPTYRNIFIRDHSHCAFGDASRYAPKPSMNESFPMFKATKESIDSLKDVDFGKPGNIMAVTAPPEIVPQQISFHRAENICNSCHRGIYRNPETKVWYHLDLMRHCRWDHQTVAAA